MPGMKCWFAIAIVCIGGLLLSHTLLMGQEGTFLFSTFSQGRFDYPVMDCNGPLSGPGWTAQIWIGPPHSSKNQLAPLLPTTTFRTDFPGYVLPVYLAAGTVGYVLGTVPTLQIRVWNNEGGTISAFSNATVQGVSPLVQSLPLGGPGLPGIPGPELIPFGEVELVTISSTGCAPRTNPCCFEVTFSRTNFVVLKRARGVFIPVRRNPLSPTASSASPDQTAQFILEDVTAKAGQDYVPQSGPVTFTSPSAGGVTVSILDSPTWRSTRSFNVRLLNPGGYSRNLVAG
jgi:hypothetical protein